MWLAGNLCLDERGWDEVRFCEILRWLEIEVDWNLRSGIRCEIGFELS